MTAFLLKIFINHKYQDEYQMREKVGLLSGFVGIICNLILFAMKLTIGLISGSMAIISDGFNNLTDTGSSIVNIVGSKFSARPADKGHPYGHGRFEYVATLVVSAIILYVGISLFINSIAKILNPEPMMMSVWIVIIMIVSILMKVWMTLFNRKLSDLINSNLLRTIASDSLSDVLATSSLLIFLCIQQVTGLYLDGYASAIIALFILYTGYKSGINTISVLLGQRPNPLLRQEIETLISQDERILGFHDLKVHDYGPTRVHATIDIELADTLDLTTAHTIIDEIESHVFEKLEVFLSIHIDPISFDESLTNQSQRAIYHLIELSDFDLVLTNFRCIKGTSRRTIMCDVRVNDSNRQEIVREIKALKAMISAHYSNTSLDVLLIDD